jgi:DeoR/GlpR family transcriptional regulator of sugar metabolism
MSRAARTILLTDSTKFGKTSFVRFGTLNQVSTIITDNQLSQNDRKAVKRAGVELILT